MADPNHIKELREAAGLGQFDLAMLLHVPATTISRWERGVQIPKASWRTALAARLRVPESALGIQTRQTKGLPE